MRTPRFRKVNDEWQARPFQGSSYRIIKRWLKGYTAYYNDGFIGNGTRLNEMKQLCNEHLQRETLPEVAR